MIKSKLSCKNDDDALRSSGTKENKNNIYFGY